MVTAVLAGISPVTAFCLLRIVAETSAWNASSAATRASRVRGGDIAMQELVEGRVARVGESHVGAQSPVDRRDLVKSRSQNAGSI